MRGKPTADSFARLERLCGRAAHCARYYSTNRIQGIERLEAFFTGHAYSLHRHDTYAFGITLSGVQSFWYRGERRHCLPQQCHILHPDEEHDGTSGTAEGFGYRIVYLDPALIQKAIGGRPLPFVAQPIFRFRDAQRRLVMDLVERDDEADEFDRVETAVVAAELLTMAAGERQPKQKSLPLDRLMRVREMIAAAPARRFPLEDLEREADLDRWTLARQFRLAFGTSPRRFRTMRQLDIVRELISSGVPLTEAAHAAGFADHSHMTRKFKDAYGLSPSRWIAGLAMGSATAISRPPR